MRAWEEIRAVALDRRSGAAELARRAAVALGDLPAGELLGALRVLLAGHPSMAPLWRLGTDVLASADHRAAARRFVAALDREREAVAAAAGGLPGVRFLTISYASTVIEALARRGPGRCTGVVCSRSEPEGEGARTAAALRARGIDAEVVDDAGALGLVSTVDAVVAGADAVTPGGVVNKAGTRALAEAARRAAVPCIVLAGELKLVGAEVPVVAPFERVPLDLVDAVAAGGDLLPPSQASALAASRPVDPRLGAPPPAGQWQG